MFPPQGLVAAALQPYTLISLLLTPNVTANDQVLNAAPTASTVTAANAKSFTGTIGQIVLPAITPAANGSGITLTSLNFTQGAIANVADSEAITVKHIVMSFAAGAALETGVLTQTAIDITLANQAANAANNQATGLKITGGTLAGGASAYQRGIDITMAAGTHNAIYVGTGSMYLGGALELTSTLTMPNNTAIQMRRASGAAQTIFYLGSDDQLYLNSPLSDFYTNYNTATGLNFWGGSAGTGRTFRLMGTDSASGAGNVSDGPTLAISAFYRNGANQNTEWQLSLLHDMTAGGAAPASSGIFKINSVAVLTLTQTNGTPSMVSAGELTTASLQVLTAGITFASTNTQVISAPNADSWDVLFKARDNGVGLVTIGQMMGAADPWFGFGGSSQFKFYNSGVANLGGTISISNPTEGYTGSINIKTVRQVVNLSGAQTSTTINIPAGAMLLGASFNVDTAVVTSAATNTWDADFVGGSTTNLVVAGALGAQNTKANKLIVPEVASAETNIEFDAPGAETFSSGAIEVVAYYIDQTSLANA